MSQTRQVKINAANLTKSISENLRNNSSKELIETKLNYMFKRKLLSYDIRNTILQELIEQTFLSDILSMRDFAVSKILEIVLLPLVNSWQPSEDNKRAEIELAELKKAFSLLISKLPENVKLNEFLELDKPIKDNSFFSDEVKITNIDSLISIIPTMSQPLREKFISFYTLEDKQLSNIWTRLSEDEDFKRDGIVEDLRFAFLFDLYSQKNLSLVKELYNLKQKGRIKYHRDLARINISEWQNIINKTEIPDDIKGDTIEEKKTNYLNKIVETIEHIHPSTKFEQNLLNDNFRDKIDKDLVKSFFRNNPDFDLLNGKPNYDNAIIDDENSGLVIASLEALREEISLYPDFNYKSDIQNNSAKFDNPVRENVLKFFSNCEAFDLDLRTVNIDSFVENNKEIVFKGIEDESEQKIVKNQIKRFQRVFNITPKYEEIKECIGNGFDSAYSIAMSPQTTFVKTMTKKMSEDKAKDYYNKSIGIASGNQLIFSKYNQNFSQVNPMVMNGWMNEIQSVANYTSLFGSLDLCDCKECQSLLSPAAYFVDLMQYLKGLKIKLLYSSLDIVLERRPDLQYLELTCDNTNKTIPYIDLVNEILENMIVWKDIWDPVQNQPRHPFHFRWMDIPSQNGEKIKKFLQALFGIPNLTDFTVDISQDKKTITISKAGQNNPQSKINPQSRIVLSDDLKEAKLIIDDPKRGRHMFDFLAKTIKGKATTNIDEVFIFPSIRNNSRSEELLANPEHFTVAAYEKIREANYPFNLPMDIWEEMARLYLEHLGTSRYEVMERFLKSDGVDIQERQISITCEYLKISRKEREILVDDDLSSVAKYYGIDTNLIDNLKEVPFFLKRTGLSYLELIEIIKTRFINPKRNIKLDSPDSTCELDKTTIKNLMPSALSKIHRFVRLWKILGWQSWELDKVISVLGENKIDDKLLLRIYYVQRLKTELDIPIIKLLTLWDNIDTITNYEESQDTDSIVSLYDMLFQNKTLMNPVDIAFELNNTRTELKYAEVQDGEVKIKMNEHVPSILAAFNISSKEFLILLKAVDVLDGLQKNIKEEYLLNIENLSKLYSNILLADCLELNITDFCSLRRLLSVAHFNLFDVEHIDNIIVFIKTARKIMKSSFTIRELDYVFRNAYSPSEGICPLEGNVTHMLTELVRGLKKISLQIIEDIKQDPKTSLNKKFAELIDKTIYDKDKDKINDALAILIESFEALTQEQQDLVKTIVDADISFLFSDLEEAKTVLTSSVEASERLEYLLNHLIRYSSNNYVKQKFSEFLDIKPDIAKLLLTKIVKSDADKKKVVIEDFVNNEFINNMPFPSDSSKSLVLDIFKRQFNSFYLLHKISLLVKKFRINEKELNYLSDHGSDFDNLNFNHLPVMLPNSGTLDMSITKFSVKQHWENLYDLFTVRNGLRESDRTLFDIFALSNSQFSSVEEENALYSKLRGLLVELTGWSLDDLEYLLDSNKGFNVEITQFVNASLIIKLKTCFDLIKRIGVSAEYLFKWAQPEINASIAEEIKNAVKSKYQKEEDWLEVVRPLNDLLREKQRTALVSFLIYKMGFSDSKALFDYFLIDVEMGSCQGTSRIKQAISSLQLFIQRCLMNLEDGVDPSLIDKERWEWMKLYRFWEANRKIFLYPENWIDPNLRDKERKSQFFEEFENELRQNQVTQESAEKAYINYLRKLDQVSDLEICGLCEEDDDGILHVIGRTRGSPRQYYYRKRKANIWHGWEKIDLDLEECNHLIPVVFTKRLYLFWPIFEVRSEESNPAANKDNPHNPEEFSVMKLAWSEYKDNKWSPKQIFANTFKFEFDWTKIISWLFFTTKVNSKKLEITIHSISRSYLVAIFHGRFNINGSPYRISIESDGSTTDENYSFPANCQSDYMNFIPEIHDDESLFVKPELKNLLLFAESIFPIQYLNTVIFQNPIENWSLMHPSTNIPPDYYYYFAFRGPYFYHDNSNAKTYLITQFNDNPADWIKGKPRYQFTSFYHKFAGEFIEIIHTEGIDSLLRLETQQKHTSSYSYWFEDTYKPTNVVYSGYPPEEVEFDPGDAYSLYNWELFFHAPFLIATKLSKNKQFEEARRWFHYIFDPTAKSSEKGTKRFWNFLPFYRYESSKPIQDLMMLLHDDDNNNDNNSDMFHILEKQMAKENMVNQINAWIADPFDPYTIAEMRNGSFQKTIVMNYIDNFIDWADNLFRRDTMESINEATLLYLLAYEILGSRPEFIPARGKIEAQTYQTARLIGFDEFSNILVELENQFPFTSSKIMYAQNNKGKNKGNEAPSSILGVGHSLYFCIPKNDKLLQYWDIVEDRLFKIRHCMNIEGITRQLPLFEPPIDPALLVRATAMGLDLSSIINDINAPRPHYRFQYVLQKAIEFCNEVKSLGGSLLAALEKRDAEELALTRTTHEKKVLSSMKEIKKQQVKEASNTLESLRKSLEVVNVRLEHYKNLEFMNDSEKTHIVMSQVSFFLQFAAQAIEMGAAGTAMVPDQYMGSAGYSSPVQVMKTVGGNKSAESMKHAADAMNLLASFTSNIANIFQIMAGYERRAEEWRLQESMASVEKKQVDKQIVAGSIRVSISEKELENHNKQIEQAQEIEDYMQNKYTNQELYEWMISQTSTVYFQSYQLAYDMAKKAEKAYQFEIGKTDTNFIQFGYWDSLRKGLLSAEQLSFDLRRLEADYLEQNKRDYEITKTVSLAMVDVQALINLREKGECDFTLEDELFAADYPSHYMRRIKTVSLTIPCVVGPYTAINCHLILQGNKIRIQNIAKDEKDYLDNQKYFLYDFVSMQSIATSHAQNDAGLFELNFRDERYLPFEGAGVEDSHWKLVMPKYSNNFDFNTISDVIIKISYTAREGGERLGAIAKEAYKIGSGAQKDGKRMFSIRHEFSTAYNRFLHPTQSEPYQKMDINISSSMFPYLYNPDSIKAKQILLFIKMRYSLEYNDNEPLSITIKIGEGDSGTSSKLVKKVGWGNLPYIEHPLASVPLPSKISLEINRAKGVEDSIPSWLRKKKAGTDEDEITIIDGKEYYEIDPDAIENIGMVLVYSANIR